MNRRVLGEILYGMGRIVMASLDNATKAANEEMYVKHMARKFYRNCSQHSAPVDKGKLLSDMDRLSIYYDRTEDLPPQYYEMITSNFQDLMEEKDDDD